MSNMTFKERSDAAFMFIENEIKSDFCTRRNENGLKDRPRYDLLGEAINDACNCFASTYEEYMDLWDIFSIVYKHDLKKEGARPEK